MSDNHKNFDILDQICYHIDGRFRLGFAISLMAKRHNLEDCGTGFRLGFAIFFTDTMAQVKKVLGVSSASFSVPLNPTYDTEY